MRYTFADFCRCSPSNLRYLHHALLIWRHIIQSGMGHGIDIVEIGGGYGGLALYVQALVSRFPLFVIRSYTIVDLPEAGALQAAYAYELQTAIKPVDGTNGDAIRAALPLSQDRILISAYAFSEFSPEVRAWYERVVIPHCQHGWLLWNMIPVYNFTAMPLTVVDERPLTGPGNKMVTF
jgi:hypothetical protein